MAVTPNYSWPIPVATDYVKDGWDAIADLGNAIDTTVAGLGSGLNLITQQSFTTQSSVSINNCFSSTYQSYRIIIELNTPSADNNFRLRLRASGTDSTTSYQGMKIQISTAGAVSGYGDANQSSWRVFSMDSSISNSYYSAFIDIANPFNAVVTTVSMVNTGFNQNDDYRGYVGGHAHSVGSSYDGFTIFPDAGTVTGTVRVYGYENS